MVLPKQASSKVPVRPLALAGSLSKEPGAVRPRHTTAAAAAAAAAAAGAAASYRVRLVRRTTSVAPSVPVPRELKARLISRAHTLDCSEFVGGTYDSLAAANAAAKKLFDTQRRQNGPGFDIARPRPLWVLADDHLWDDGRQEYEFNWKLKRSSCGASKSVVLNNGLACHTQEMAYEAGFLWSAHEGALFGVDEGTARATCVILVEAVATGGAEGAAGSDSD